MNLMEVLLYQNQSELIKLLQKDHFNINMNSKRELIECIYPSLVNAQYLCEKIQHLSHDAKKMLLAICFDDRLSFSKEELYPFSSSQKSFFQLYEELHNVGFLFIFVNNEYVLPPPTKQLIRNIFKVMLEDTTIFFPKLENNDRGIPIIQDIYSFIEYIVETPLPLTKNGVLYKKDFLKLNDTFIIPETLPNEQWRFGYGRRFAAYPNRFSLMYDYLYSNGLICEDEGFLRVTNTFEQLYNLKLDEFIKGIIQFWIKTYKRAIPMLPYLYRWIVHSVNKESYLEEEALTDLLQPYVNQYYYDKPASIVKVRILEMLCHLNVLVKREAGVVTGYTEGVAKFYINM